MSLRIHQIKSSYGFFEPDVDDETSRRISKPAKPEIRVVKSETTTQEKDSLWQKIGMGMVRTGVAILSVPDPLPFIDEGIGIGLVAGGATILYLEQ